MEVPGQVAGLNWRPERSRENQVVSCPGGAALIRLTEDSLQYLVLGDTTVVVDTTDGIEVFNDDRVDTTAQAERAEANRYPFGSAQKQAALLRMKHAELALRDQPGGFWLAAAGRHARHHRPDPADSGQAGSGADRWRRTAGHDVRPS